MRLDAVCVKVVVVDFEEVELSVAVAIESKSVMGENAPCAAIPFGFSQ